VDPETAALDLFSKDTMFVCPFNRAHRVVSTKYPWHLHNCKVKAGFLNKGNHDICSWNILHYIEKGKLEQHEAFCTSREDSGTGQLPAGDPMKYDVEGDDELNKLITEKTGTYCRICKQILNYVEVICPKCFLLNPQLLFVSTQYDLKNFAPKAQSDTAQVIVRKEKKGEEGDGQKENHHKSRREKEKPRNKTPYDRQ